MDEVGSIWCAAAFNRSSGKDEFLIENVTPTKFESFGDAAACSPTDLSNDAMNSFWQFVMDQIHLFS